MDFIYKTTFVKSVKSKHVINVN